MGYVERLQEEARRRIDMRRFGLPADEGAAGPMRRDEKEDAHHDRELLEEYRRFLREARARRGAFLPDK
jgi:ribosome-binding protein aMBF1 (putative translation factor)